MKKYILTGGPGSGKSSILLYLEQHGAEIIREAAEDQIKLKQAQGIAEPWKEENFQLEILLLQQYRERQAEKANPFEAGTAYSSGYALDERKIFIDRGLPDGLAYQAPGKIRDFIETAAMQSQYELVFIVEQLATTEKNSFRRENKAMAKALELRLERIYKELGYKPIRIPAGTVEERAYRIMNEVTPCTDN